MRISRISGLWLFVVGVLIISTFLSVWLFLRNDGGQQPTLSSAGISEQDVWSTAVDGGFPTETKTQETVAGEVLSLSDQSVVVASEIDGEVNITLDPETTFHSEICRDATPEEVASATDSVSQTCDTSLVDRTIVSVGSDVAIVLKGDTKIASSVMVFQKK